MCDPLISEKPEMPLGDPVKGLEWDSTRPDPGTYDGNDLWKGL